MRAAEVHLKERKKERKKEKGWGRRRGLGSGASDRRQNSPPWARGARRAISRMCAARASSGPCGLGGRLQARVRFGRAGIVRPCGPALFRRPAGLWLLPLSSAASASSVLLFCFRFCVRWVWCSCRCHLLLRRRRFGLHVVSVNVTVGGFCSAGRWVLGCCCCLLLFPLLRPCSAWSVCRCRGWAFSLFSAVGGSGAVVAAIRSAASISVGAVVGLCLWICGRWVRCCCHWLRLLLLRRFCSAWSVCRCCGRAFRRFR